MSALGLASLGAQCVDKALGIATLGAFCGSPIIVDDPKTTWGGSIPKKLPSKTPHDQIIALNEMEITTLVIAAIEAGIIN